MDDENRPVECHPRFEIKKQKCGYCPEDKCLLNCEICNPNLGGMSSYNC